MKLNRVVETCIYVSDLDAAEVFYTSVLGLDVYSRQTGRHVFFRCGEAMFLVFNPAQTEIEPPSTAGPRFPRHGSRGPGHVGFAMAHAEVDTWRAKLEAAGVTIDTDVRWPNGAHSLYFRDPSGNIVELVTPDLWGLADA